MRTSNTIAAMVAVTCSAGIAAAAGPRDSLSVSGLHSDGSPTGFSTLQQSPGYAAKFARLSGTLKRVQAGTLPSEALVCLTPPGSGLRMAFATTNGGTFDGNGNFNVDTFVRLPHNLSSSGGQWAVSYVESFDDGAGVDATWQLLTITLFDGPPAAMDLGQLSPGVISVPVSKTAQETKWFTFTLATAADAAISTFLDIDTEGSLVLSNNDLEIALYNEDGIRVGANDDGGSAFQSMLSYGLGGRPAVGSGTPYAGQDGTLPAGRYYLGVRGVDQGSGDIGWDFKYVSGPLQTGEVRVNLRTNTGTPSPLCVADVNRSGSSTIDDLFLFLNAWFTGCP